MMKFTGKRLFLIYCLILLSLALICCGAFCAFYKESFAKTYGFTNDFVAKNGNDEEVKKKEANAVVFNAPNDSDIYTDFDDLRLALERAKVGDEIKYSGEFKKSVSVKEGVTLILIKPSDFLNEDFEPISLPSDIVLTIDGSLIVGLSDDIISPFSEEFSKNLFEVDGKIVVNGDLTVNLPIGGSGEIVVNGELTDTLYITDFVNEEVFKTLYNENKSPFNEYVGIVRCKTTINNVGSFRCSIYTEKDFLCNVNLIGKGEDCFLNLEDNGRVEILYDKSVCIKETVGKRNLKNFGKTTITFYGNLKVNPFTMIFKERKIVFSNIPFAIPYNVEVVLKDGEVNLSDNAFIKVLPGGSLYVENVSTLNLYGGLIAYDGFLFLENDGIVYPNADILYRYGFSKCGNLFVNGTINVYGKFAGTVQTDNPGSIIKVFDDALLGGTLSEGSEDFRVANLTEIYQGAKVAGLNEFYELEKGKTYKSVAISPKTLDFIIVDKAVTGIDKTLSCDKKIYLYQDFNGRFFESVGEDCYLCVDVYIGEKSKNVCVNVNGKNYYTNADGVFTARIKVKNDLLKIDYYSPRFEDGSVLHSYNLNYDEDIVLSEVVKGVTLSEENDYIINYDETIQSFYVDIDYYGGNSFTYEVFPDIKVSDRYVKEVDFLPNGFKNSDDLKGDLYFYKEELDEYKNLVNGLIDGLLTKEKVENVYFAYLNIINGLSKKEFDYLSDCLAGLVDFEYAVNFSVADLTYGDEDAEALVTFVDGSQKTEKVKVLNYDYINGDIVATVLYEGVYRNIEYSVENKVYNVAPAEILYLTENKSSVYLDDILPLTGRISKGELKFSDDINSVVRLYTSAKKDSPVGNYYITGECLSPFYKVSFANSTYKIIKRKVLVASEETTVKFSESKNIVIPITADYKDAVKGFAIYKEDEKVAIIDLYGNLSEDLAIGEYKVLPIIDEENFTLASKNYSVLKIVPDSKDYVVSFGITNGYIKEYDGEEFLYNVTVTDLNTKISVDDDNIEVSVCKDGNLTDKILSVGNYTIKVVVFEQVFTINLSVVPRRLKVVAKDFSIYYGDDLPEVKFEVDYINLPENVLAFRLSEGKLLCESVDENFVVESCLGAVTILPRPITVICHGGYKYYGDSDGQIYCQISEGSLAFGDSLSKILVVEREVGESVGEYDIKIKEGSVDGEKYAVTLISEKFYVYPRKIAVAIDNVKAVYGETFDLSANVIIGNLVSSDDVESVIKLFVNEEDLSVGVYQIGYEILSDNYAVTVLDGNLTITAKKIAVNLPDREKVYGNEDNLTAVCTEGSISFDDLLKIIRIDREVGETVGEYKITIKVIDENYKVDINYSKNGFSVFTITPRKIEIAINNLTVDFTEGYDKVINKITSTVTKGEAISGDNLEIGYKIIKNGEVFDKELFEASSEVGIYEIVGSVKNENYEALVNSGYLTVDKKLIEVVGVKTDYVYCGEVLLPFNRKTDIVNGEFYSEVDFIISYEIKRDDGVYYAVDKMLSAGEYRVTVSVKEADKYKFVAGENFTYNCIVSKLDVSDNLSLTIENGYVIIGKNRPIARLFGFDAKLEEELFYGETNVSNVEKEGEYLLKITVKDDDLFGSIEVNFFAYNDVSEKITEIEDLLGKMKTHGDAKLSDLLKIRDILVNLSDGDLLQIEDNSAYKSVIDDFSKEYADFLKGENERFEKIQSVYNSFESTVVYASFSIIATLCFRLLFKRRIK